MFNATGEKTKGIFSQLWQPTPRKGVESEVGQDGSSSISCPASPAPSAQASATTSVLNAPSASSLPSRAPTPSGSTLAPPTISSFAPHLSRPVLTTASSAVNASSVLAGELVSHPNSSLSSSPSTAGPLFDQTEGEGEISKASSFVDHTLGARFRTVDRERSSSTLRPKAGDDDDEKTDGGQSRNESDLSSDEGDVLQIDDRAAAVEGDTAQETHQDPRDVLKAQLRKSEAAVLTRRTQRSVKGKEKATEVRLDPDDEHGQKWSANPFRDRLYFILTSAGKPVYISREAEEDEDDAANTVGVMQALISVFADEEDKIRCINYGDVRISFLLRSPLYFVCVSSWGEPESVLRAHLDYLHLQILSVVTSTQLTRIFQRRNNFDLRRLLEGTDHMLSSLTSRLSEKFDVSFSALQPLRLDPGLREDIAKALMPKEKIKDLLYAILLADDKIVTLVRPRKHSIYPSDLHLLVNTIQSSSSLRSSESWIPICLPKFTSAGFLHAYVSFLSTPSELETSTTRAPTSGATTPERSASATGTASPNVGSVDPQRTELSELNEHADDDTGNAPEDSQEMSGHKGEIALVLVTGNREGFFEMSEFSKLVVERLQKRGAILAMKKALQSHDYSSGDLGIPGLRHFVYKSRPNVQLTSPAYEAPYDEQTSQRRLLTLYQRLYDAIHARSGQHQPVKLQYVRTEKEAVLGWITQPFELYLALSPMLPKTAAISAANAVSRWVKREEQRLFLISAPVF